jgi:phosphatidylglycerophosphate synthase
MDMGLYNLKYPFRKTISWLLPLVKNVSPNAISWSLLPIGVLTALCYYAAKDRPLLFLAGAGLIFLRMIVSTLDGLAAVTYRKCTPEGELVNRIAPELCDAMLMVAVVLAEREHLVLGILVLAAAWLTSFAGLVGLAGGKQIQSVGPVGQTDRVTALLVLSLAGSANYFLEQPLDVLNWFLWWCVLGGFVTVVLRLSRHLAVTDRSAAANYTDVVLKREG